VVSGTSELDYDERATCMRQIVRRLLMYRLTTA
jgi:hypothetical protein